jgi:hypothetical protein
MDCILDCEADFKKKRSKNPKIAGFTKNADCTAGAKRSK